MKQLFLLKTRETGLTVLILDLTGKNYLDNRGQFNYLFQVLFLKLDQEYKREKVYIQRKAIR